MLSGCCRVVVGCAAIVVLSRLSARPPRRGQCPASGAPPPLGWVNCRSFVVACSLLCRCLFAALSLPVRCLAVVGAPAAARVMPRFGRPAPARLDYCRHFVGSCSLSRGCRRARRGAGNAPLRAPRPRSAE